MNKLTNARIIISNYWLLSVGGTYLYFDRSEYKKPQIEKLKLALCGPLIPFVLGYHYLDLKYNNYKFTKYNNYKFTKNNEK